MHQRSGGKLSSRSIASASIALSGALILAGCTVSPVVSGDQTPQVTSVPAPTEILPTAVMTIASVDVDGLNASVAGYITEVSEEGGTCTYVLMPEFGEPVTASGPSAANIGTTSCGTVQVPMTSLFKGSWTVVLEYTSPELDLVSEPIPMEVP